MAKHIRYFLLIPFLSGVISSCSKDESTPVPVSPKLLKEVKTVYKNQITGLLDSGITAFDYNDKSQITKMTFKHDPGSYKVIEYNGDLPITSKDYYNNNLIKTRTNFVSVSGNTIIVTYLNDPAPGTTDSVIFKYSFEGENITLSQTLLIKIAGDDIDTRSYYTYTSGNLASVRYRSFLNGVEGTG
jgi:hypothetical protein